MLPYPPLPRTGSRRFAPDSGCLAAACFGLCWAVLSLWPDLDLPAWPSVSLGIVALWLGRFPGRPLRRGLGSYLGLLSLLIGLGQIALTWLLVQAVAAG